MATVCQSLHKQEMWFWSRLLDFGGRRGTGIQGTARGLIVEVQNRVNPKYISCLKQLGAVEGGCILVVVVPAALCPNDRDKCFVDCVG